jgi:hypothetical protein
MFIVVATAASLSGCGAKSAMVPADEIVTPRASADVILNDKMPWPPSPGMDVTLKDELGFASDRLFHVPPPGVHPRILFAPEDLPRIRKQLEETATGKMLMAYIRDGLSKGIDSPGTWENMCFTALVNGDAEGFGQLYKTDFAKRSPGSPPAAGSQNPAFRWGTGDAFIRAMELRCWVALIDNDTAKGKENAAAVTTYAKVIQRDVDIAAKGPRGEDWWRGIRPALNSADDLAFYYDWTAPFMTPEQAAVVRRLIASATAGKYTLGMDLPHHWRNWNFIGMSLSQPVLALAIEGEEGYDPRVYARGIEVARDYLTYGISDMGFSKEGIGYQTGGMNHTGILMLAAANRGTNLFIHPHYQRFMSDYLIQAMQPFGGAWQSEGDLASFPPSIAVVMVAKYFYPKNKQIDTVLRNHPFLRSESPAKDLMTNFREIVLTCPADTDEPPACAVIPPADASLTAYDPQRGMLITRTDWTPDATVLHLDCRSDTTFPAHDHPDRGRFILSSMGCAWAITGNRDTETKYQSCVTIDGRGQGYFPTPGKWIDMIDKPEAVMGIVDTKYCWDWFWMKSIMVVSEEQLKREGQDEYIPARARLLGRFPVESFERDRSPEVLAYYKGYMAGDPRMWSEDSWIVRSPHFPVERAFRTVSLMRGKHPYVLVVDDIQKDKQERLYEWRMICPTSVDVVSILGNDIILSNTPANTPKGEKQTVKKPRLLVRGLNINQPAIPTNQPNPTLETVELKKHDDTHQFAGRSNGLAKRLVLPSRSVAPDYKVLLVPHREGEPLPTTTWNDNKTQVTVEWPDQKDTLEFTKAADGRTRISLTRDGSRIIDTK